jgi:hypothetical protein
MLDTQARSGSDQQWDDLLLAGDSLLDEIQGLLDQVPLSTNIIWFLINSDALSSNQLGDMNSIHAVLTTNADSNGFYEQEEVRQRESRQKFLTQSFTRLRHSADELKQKATLW